MFGKARRSYFYRKYSYTPKRGSMVSFLQMKHWAQHLGAYLFMGSPDQSKNSPDEAEPDRTYSPRSPSSSHAPARLTGSVTVTPQIELLNGYLCATTVDTQPRRLAWLLKLHLAIVGDLAEPIVVPMELTQVNLQVAELPEPTQLPSIYLQPPRKLYIPSASSHTQSLSPLIDGTDSELVIRGEGEFFLHASGGTAYFLDIPAPPITITVHLPLAATCLPVSATFVPAESVTKGVQIWSLT